MSATNLDPEHRLKYMKDEAFQYVDFRFTDPLGIWHHMTFKAEHVNLDILEEGIMIDGSSIPGWRSIEDSDMIIKPDLNRCVKDVFATDPTLIIFCDAVDPHTQQGYNRDPRSIAKRAEEYLINSRIADTAYFGPEPEFFIFDAVHFENGGTYGFYQLTSAETSIISGPLNGPSSFGTYNLGHRPTKGGGYAPVQPVDSLHELRAKMLSKLGRMGLKAEKHHHEVAQSQHELGFEYDTLLRTADNLQIYKYVVRQVAHNNGKSATFLPKPIYGDNGSGMHVHQSLWADGRPLFSGNQYDHLSEEALYYIGGILKHAKALTAFTNPTTNSFKRLVPGYEAPVYLAYSARNRSAAVRIPHTRSPKAKRVEVRFPDPTANPYLALSAMLMAGLDGIKNKIHPGEAMERNLYDAKNHNLGPDQMLCRSLTEALGNLDQDRAFLTEGGVFDDDQINAFIEMKHQEIVELNRGPTPAEFQLYYSL
ncbi:MAG: type I glutamate--ammonia ligase [Holosporales bacterium]